MKCGIPTEALCSDQSYKCVPFYISSNGYGVFVDSSDKVSYEIASDTVSKVSITVPGEEIEYFVIGGENLHEVLSNYTTLTGKPTLPPAENVRSVAVYVVHYNL